MPFFWPRIKIYLHRPEKRQISWPGHDCETGDLAREAARLANTPASRSKQAVRATPKGSLRCFVPRAKSPNFLICCVLSIRVTLFEGRNLKLTVVSTQTAHFVDRCIRSIKLSTKTHLFVDRSLNSVLASTEIPVFMDKSTKLTVVSTKQHLFMDGELNVAVMAILGPSHKRQSRHADPHARRKDRPQGSEALPES